MKRAITPQLLYMLFASAVSFAVGGQTRVALKQKHWNTKPVTATNNYLPGNKISPGKTVLIDVV